jgi:hypothetical protein
MKNKLFFRKIIFIVSIIFAFSVFIPHVLAQSVPETNTSPVKSLLETAGGAAKYDVNSVESGDISLASITGGIIQIFLSLLGIIFIGLLIYGGFLWMNARGNTEQVAKAMDLIKDAVIGLVIVAAAYAITYFVLYMLAREYVDQSVRGF